MIIVSACLLGENCKYSGGNNKSENVIKYLEDKEYILVCPEQLGGLSTPRNPSEIITYGNKDGNDVLSGCTKVLSNKGIDVTKNFIQGAEETLKIAKEHNAKTAILKAGSPSCGYKKIYDGSFLGNKIQGMGVTAAILNKENIALLDEDDI
ncbi:DUF523 domain-containing protein [Intestinibacter bartlettii]|uniref:DUF523 domain-containing protein n=1 Tax=Intestinibacter bartlettii TaxID=261299 RepID=A0ABS8CYQ0_9FIRM|nr:DUF523 domain-containing protein [Intestinibacter bartlettii]MCB5397780.1 DUF523 domain-containing protein [Intestinibacter bartlettii]MCB5404185.1 DUF523 domain-containing protein [Intestinibacter bartlettii]MCB5446592.1 DUF523 domain-containing protein [Intestinibacter bartlettii]MCB5720896.1 DUF523 domain-containing protein [Intestinibacter bartlettii]MCB5749320.1 DUF523 domain-containing protein [Intestinibacter bartlettii]